MKPSRVIQGTFFLMLAVQTVGSIDGQHRLPAPRQYVAISVLWGILFLFADTGWNKIAARLSILVVLTGMVLGPFGKTAIGFLNMVSTTFTTKLQSRFSGGPANPATGDTGATVA